MSAVIVDKNFNAICAVADSIAVLVKGSVAVSGDARSLRAQPDLLQRHLGV